MLVINARPHRWTYEAETLHVAGIHHQAGHGGGAVALGVMVRSVYNRCLGRYMGSSEVAENGHVGINDGEKTNGGIDQPLRGDHGQVRVPQVPVEVHGKL